MDRGVNMENEGQRCSHPKGRMKFGDIKPTGARESPISAGAVWEPGCSCDSRARAGGLDSRPGQRRSRARPRSPQPAAIGGSGGPEDSKAAASRSNGDSAGSTPGYSQSPHLEYGSTGGSRRRNPPQRNERHRK